MSVTRRCSFGTRSEPYIYISADINKYKYIYIYIYTGVYLHIFKSHRLRLWEWNERHAPLQLWDPLRTIYRYICRYKYIHIYTHTYIYIYIYKSINKYIYINKFISTYIYKSHRLDLWERNECHAPLQPALGEEQHARLLIVHHNLRQGHRCLIWAGPSKMANNRFFL